VAAVPLWQKAVQREREQELIFRGYQYMQAIERYQRKYPGAYPRASRCSSSRSSFRKAYKDPLGEGRRVERHSPALPSSSSASSNSCRGE
jgi:type II secretory pathway pseudopilin PulG